MIYDVYACYAVEVGMLCSMYTSSNVRCMCISVSTYASFMQASSIHGGLVHCIYSHVIYSVELNFCHLISITQTIGLLQSKCDNSPWTSICTSE